MPPRWLRWLIGMFWLMMTGWLFHDLAPSWRSGEPPPFHVDVVDEVRKGNPPQTKWIVRRVKVGENAFVKVFRGTTWVEYHNKEDTYALNAFLDVPKTPNPKYPPVEVAKGFKIDSIKSTYHVARDGRLRALDAEVKARPHFDWPGGELFQRSLRMFLPQLAKRLEDAQAVRHVSGEVRDEHFFGHCGAAGLPRPPRPAELPPTAVSYTGSVLMPLHPLNQMSGLHPGQRWRQPILDPLLVWRSGFSGSLPSLTARVLPQPHLLDLGDGEKSCLVIQYTNDEEQTTGRTWVGQSSNRVLKQEVILEDYHWIITRDLSPRIPPGLGINDLLGRLTPLRNKP